MSTLGSFVWSIADQLRGVYRPNQYGGVILPFTILRRLDCLMEPHRDEMRTQAEKYEGVGLTARVKRTTGMPFHNTSPFDFAELLKDPEGLAANLIDYTTGSPTISTCSTGSSLPPRSRLSRRRTAYTWWCPSSPRSTCTRTPSPTPRWVTCSRS